MNAPEATDSVTTAQVSSSLAHGQRGRPACCAASKRRSMRLTAFGLAAITLGLLLWARFILVTGHPRTAIAEPAKAAQSASDAENANEFKPNFSSPGLNQ